LWEYGIKSVAIHGEHAAYDPDFIRHIKKYCSTIKSLYDWDEAGYKASERLLIDFDIHPIEKPDNLNCKDVSDCMVADKENTIKFLKTIK